MEVAILDWIQTIRNPYFDIFFSVLTRLGDHAEIWLLLILIMAFQARRRKSAMLSVVAIALEILIVSLIMKPLVMRGRPFLLSEINLLIPAPSGHSFPSGHSASSFAIAFLLFREDITLKWPVIITAGLMAFSRLYVYVHFPSDVLIGSLIGIAIGEIVYRNQRWIIEKYNQFMHFLNLDAFTV